MRSKKHGNRLPPFVPLVWEMLNSKAYFDLQPSAAKVLPYFLGKVKKTFNDPQRYQEEFQFSYCEAKRLGFASATFHKCISQLIEKGFIDPDDKGGLRGLGRTYSFFTLSWRWKDYGKPGFEIIVWRCFLPRDKSKAKAKAKMETCNTKNGKQERVADEDISKNDAVEAILR